MPQKAREKARHDRWNLRNYLWIEEFRDKIDIWMIRLWLAAAARWRSVSFIDDIFRGLR